MKPKELKKLQDKWNRKLKAEGLEDIEDSQGRLKVWHSQWFCNRTSPIAKHTDGHSKNRAALTNDVGQIVREGNTRYFNAKQTYYYQAEHFLTEYTFASKLDRKFWELHVKGHSNREIEKMLKTNRKTLGKIMRRLMEVMRTWKF